MAGIGHSGGVLRAAVGLVLPPSCAGCGAGGAVLCPRCSAPLRGPAGPHTPVPRPVGLPPLWATTRYDGAVRAALIGYKDRNRRDLAAPLAAALARAVRSAAGPVAAQPLVDPAVAVLPVAALPVAAQPVVALPLVGPRVALVPVPSRRAAARRRGGDHVLRLARVAAGLFGGQAVVCPALRPHGRLADAAGLSAQQRRTSRVGTLAVHAAYTAWLAGRAGAPAVVLVDDLVTTGATLAEAAVTLRGAGVPVWAAAVIAATQRSH